MCSKQTDHKGTAQKNETDDLGGTRHLSTLPSIFISEKNKSRIASTGRRLVPETNYSSALAVFTV